MIGSLVDKDITLERVGVVTTTWGEWRRRHPDTQVLSLNTGYARDYGEGVAYKEYFSTDELMFAIPKKDKRLKNKAEVLGLIFSEHRAMPLALSVDYLKNKKLYHDRVGDLDFVVLTDESGASRVYETEGLIFQKWDRVHTLVDDNAITWELSENQLVSSNGDILHRLPAHRAFWFGW